jgi:thymidylate synthase (FAD)
VTHQIVTEPNVALVACTRLNPAGFFEFVEQNELQGPLESLESPLFNIGRRVEGLADDVDDPETLVEIGGRMCYRSWERGRETPEYLLNILDMGHGSVLEHSTLNFVISGISRSLTHELVRHRVGVAISQESQRYVDAADIRYVMPPMLLHFLDGDMACQEAKEWLDGNLEALESYEKWREWLNMSLAKEIETVIVEDEGDPDLFDAITPKNSEKAVKRKRAKALSLLKKRANEAARGSLPNCCETKVLWSANLRTLRHFIKLRGAEPADLEIRRLAVALLRVCKEAAPFIFQDMEIQPGAYGVPCVGPVNS